MGLDVGSWPGAQPTAQDDLGHSWVRLSMRPYVTPSQDVPGLFYGPPRVPRNTGSSTPPSKQAFNSGCDLWTARRSQRLTHGNG